MKYINNLFENVKICWFTLMKIAKKYFVIRLIYTITFPIVEIIMIYLMKWILDGLVDYSEDKKCLLSVFLLCYFSAKVVEVILNGMAEYSEKMESLSLKKYIGEKLIKICSNLDIQIYDDVDAYDEIQYVQGNYDALSNLIWKTIEILSSLVAFALIFSVSVNNILIYVIVMILACIPAGVSRINFTKKMYDLNISQLANERKVDYITSLVTEKEYAQEIRSYFLDKFLVDKYNKTWIGLLIKQKRILKSNCKISIVLLILPEIVFLWIMFVVVNNIVSGIMTIGDFSLYIGIITQIWGNVLRIIYNINEINEDNFRVDFYKKFTRRTPKIISGDISISSIENIVFKDVYFKYPNMKSYVLNGFNLEVRKGEKVAIVGENGAGKSTIVKLLLRFYDIASGEILINNIDIKKYNLEDLRKNIGMYFQESRNYAFTLWENIILSDYQNPERKRVEKALHISGMDEFIQEKELKYDFYISKMFNIDGIELSGGQNQRLALSRTVYKESDLFIFDEPSAALDPKIEHAFFEKIRKISGDKTVIYISHRLSNISISDKIVVINNGRVVEEGSINELINKKGEFYEYYTYQASSFDIIGKLDI